MLIGVGADLFIKHIPRAGALVVCAALFCGESVKLRLHGDVTRSSIVVPCSISPCLAAVLTSGIEYFV